MLLVAPLIVNVHAATPIVFDSSQVRSCLFSLSCVSSSTVPPNTLSWTHIVGSGANPILIVAVSMSLPVASGVPGVTYGSKALTNLGSNPANDVNVELWALLNPPAGSDTVTVTLSVSPASWSAASISFFNVVGTEAFTAVSGDVTPTVIVNAHTGDVVVDVLALTTSPPSPVTTQAGAGQTPYMTKVDAFDGDGFVAAGSYAPASYPVTMTWTISNLVDWSMIGVALIPSTPIPEYPLGLTLLAAFMITAYGLIRRRTALPKN